MLDYRNLNAPDLVKQWKKIVNDHVQIGRDAHMIKEKLAFIKPVQILLGMYRYKEQSTCTVPQFLREYERWLEDDELEAEIELCCFITESKPPEYLIYQDLKDDISYEAYQALHDSKIKLIAWTNEVL